MSFLIGPSPIRRTLNFLKSCPLIFKDQVKIMEVHYNFYRNPLLKRPLKDVHFGLKDFYYWNVDSIQYVNPDLQIVRFNELNPYPFIRCWLENGTDVFFDCDSKSKDEIMDQLIKILGKSKKDLEEQKLKDLEAKKDNPAIFGFGKKRFCFCEIEGQVPCPGVVELPKNMKNKYIYNKPEELEAFEADPNAELWDYEKIRNKFWNKLTLEPEKKTFKGIERLQVGKIPVRTKVNPFEKFQKTYLEMKKDKKTD